MKNFQLTTSLLVGLIATGSAYAGGAAPFYVGITAGKVTSSNEANQMDNAGLCSTAGSHNETCTISDGGVAGHIYGGAQVTDGLAIEAGYANLGTTAEYDYSDPINVKQKTSGVTVAGVVRQRISKASPVMVYGKAGAMRWSSETEVNSTNSAVPSVKVKQNGVAPIIGAGIEYEMTDNMTLKAGWDRYYNAGKKDAALTFDKSGVPELNTIKNDVDVISAGVNFNFF